MIKVLLTVTLLIPVKSIRLLETKHQLIKSGESITYILTLPERKPVTLLISGKFPEKTLIKVSTDKEEYSVEKGADKIDYAVFPFTSPHKKFKITLKNLSDKDEEVKFYIDSSLVDIKEIPMRFGFFVKEFTKGEGIAKVECILPFRSSSRIWLKKVKDGKIEDALYTSLTYAKNMALKKAKVMDEPGKYLLFAEVEANRGFVNCEVKFEKMAVKEVRKWKGTVLLIIGGVAILVAGILLFIKKS